jgi:hypothetical protein
VDALVRRFSAVPDKDLMICEKRGVAYQTDMAKRTESGVNAAGENYFDHYSALDGQQIGRQLYAGRVGLVNKYVPDVPVLDVGVGSGEFIKSRANTFGTDVNPKAREWLSAQGLLRDDFGEFGAFTFWDVLEHIDAPNEMFQRMPERAFLFTSLPIFADLTRVRKSRHYKPGEHLYYWTEPGFIDWMAQYRFRLLEKSSFETQAGRDSIGSYAFVRDLPGYRQTVDQYKEMHSRSYGATAYLYFETIAKEVLKLNPSSILDFGCGRSDLVAHFWNDGRRAIAKYDPAIPLYKRMPSERFDLALCTDVMEHIPMVDIDSVLNQIRAKAPRALFTISMIPARAELPDGRNAHVSLLDEGEWTRWIASVFKKAKRIQTQWDHILMLRTW